MKAKLPKQNILQKTIWFEERTKYDINFFDILEAQRTVNEHSRSTTGIFYSEKCQREVQYESGMELDFIRQLEKNKDVLFYYEQPVRIPYRRGYKNITYTPDFALFLKTKEVILVEVKELPTLFDHNVQKKVETLFKHCSGKGFGLLLTDGKDSIDKILKAKQNKKLEKAILQAIDGHTIRKRECNELMKCNNGTQAELLKVILKHNLRYRTFPFRLQTGGKNIVFRQLFFEKRRYNELEKEKFSELLRLK